MGVGMPAPASTLEIARALIRFPSVTPIDGGALPYLSDLLGRSGFATELVTFEAPGTPAVLNLYARFGVRSPNLAFAGHTDVVPPGDKALWRFDPFSGEIADGQLWGRGACDMKGGVAASAAAAMRFIVKGAFEGSISFLITGDEEDLAVNGTVKLVDWALAKGETFDHCILGESTSVDTVADTIKHGRRGSLNGRITISGRQGHAAYPHIADNPIPALAPILTALLSSPLDQGNADFEPTNLEVVSVDVGNPAFNVIPGEVRLKFNVRFNDLWTPDSLSAEIARRVAAADVGGRATLTFEPCNAVAFLTKPGAFTDLVAEAVTDVTGRKPSLSTGGGTSDARFIKNACPVVELGLVNATIHGVDERVALDDLEALSRVYERALELYFAQPPA
jgi:succinyl-diaminopimelate desuccinylase